MYRADSGSDKHLKFGLASMRSEKELARNEFHRHNEIEIVLVEKGRIGHLIGGELVWFDAGRLAAFWGAVPHTPVEVAAGSIINWLTIPFSWFLEWRLPRAFT